jgi:predicted outer membrane repeat protein
MTNTIVVTTAADSGVGSLREAIATATTGTTIQFAPNLANQTIQLTSGSLQIAPGQQISIDGQGAVGLTISGGRASRIFFVNSNQDFPAGLTLRNLILANGYTPEVGGAIYVTHRGNVSVEQVNFRNNIADQGGGAIYSAWETNLTVVSSQFQGNQATATNSERGGGAITFVSPGNLIVRNSEFINNRGINGGAINSLNGKLSIQDSRFIDNDTLSAYFANGDPRDYLRGFGGAVFVDRASGINEASGNVNISNTVFERNRGRNEGGGVYIYAGTQDQVAISRTVFKDNQVLGLPTPTSDGSESLGGGLVVLSNGLNRGLTIDETTFVNNQAGGQGGGLWTSDTPTTIRNSTFSGNRVTGSSNAVVGGGLTVNSPTTVINSTIANNAAGWSGGGLSAGNAPVNVQNTIFTNNTAANPWGIQQHTNRELTDWGGNIQFPPKQTTFWNDVNATANIRLLDPSLGPLEFQSSQGQSSQGQSSQGQSSQGQNGQWVHPLLTGSAAINQGVGNGLTTDQLGRIRADGSIDSGAFEFGTTAPVTPTVTTPTATTPLAAAPLVAAPTAPTEIVPAPATPVPSEIIPVAAMPISPLEPLEERPILEPVGNNILTGGSSNDPLLFPSSPETAGIDLSSNPLASNPVGEQNPIKRVTGPFNLRETGLNILNRDGEAGLRRRGNCPRVDFGTGTVIRPLLITCPITPGTLLNNPNGQTFSLGEMTGISPSRCLVGNLNL